MLYYIYVKNRWKFLTLQIYILVEREVNDHNINSCYQIVRKKIKITIVHITYTSSYAWLGPPTCFALLNNGFPPSRIPLCCTSLGRRNVSCTGFAMPLRWQWSHRNQSHVPVGHWCLYFLWKVTWNFRCMSGCLVSTFSLIFFFLWEGRLKKIKIYL